MVRILGQDALSTAAALISGGGIVAFPTDTVYGLACDPWSVYAVARLFAAKGREDKPIPVLCSSLDKARAVAKIEGLALELAERFWPGALTIVAPLRRNVPFLLDQGSGWLGVRVPNHRFALSLASETGGYVSGTSANLSGQPSCTTAQEVALTLGDRVDVIIDGGPAPGVTSTVVKVDGRSIEVLRRGAISIEPGTTQRSSDT